MLTCLLVGLLFGCCANIEAESKLNIIYVRIDDLGYRDVGSFNKEGIIKTPNIDKLAAEGMKFTDAHKSSSVCFSTRDGILTGRYNWRSRFKEAFLKTTIQNPNKYFYEN